MKAFLDRFFGHPVLGRFGIILLFTLVLSMACYLAGRTDLGVLVSVGGMVVAWVWVFGNIVRDLFK